MTALYRPIDLPGMAEPLGIAEQPSPMLQWVEIATMVIDEHYQRPISHGGMRTIKAIAANFRWSCFTPVLLAPIEGGKFAVIDGQHRVHAALLCGVKSVPAMVVPIAATEQAQAFIQVNSVHTTMSQFNKLRAGLAAGEAWAIEADRAVSDAGCRLLTFTPASKNRKPGELMCVGLVREMVERNRPHAVTVALKAVGAIQADGTSDVLLYSDWLLNPLMRAVAEFPDLDAETLIAILRWKRPFLVIEQAERLAKAEGRSHRLEARKAFITLIKAHLTLGEAN